MTWQDDFRKDVRRICTGWNIKEKNNKLVLRVRTLNKEQSVTLPFGFNEYQKADALMGMASNRLGAANQARAAATQSIMSGVGSLASAAGTYMDSLE